MARCEPGTAAGWAEGKSDQKCTCIDVTIIKVFVKCKINCHPPPSPPHTHTGTCTHEHSDYTKLKFMQLILV